MKGMTRTALGIFVAFALFFAVQWPSSSVYADKAEKSVKQFEIAVVFDNSGSMYYKTDAWCKAKYAMEIFASMLQYENGDILKVYPMWEVTTDGSKTGSGGSYDPIEINCIEDIDKLSNMYTAQANDTPFEPVRTAYSDLKKSDADERWLVILTDGEFDEDSRCKKADINLQSELSKMASSDIKVQYLGLGEADKLKSDEDHYLYASKATNKSLNQDLIDICNRIFQRALLPEDCIKNDKMTFEISMKNIIVFAQGKNVKINSIKDSDGNSLKVVNDSGQRKYSTISAGNIKNAPVDKSLAGQVVMFGGADTGIHKLSVSNADSENIQVFYEPDVDIKLTVKDKNGKKVKLSKVDSLASGKYTVDYAMIDAKTKEDISKSDLLGKVKYEGAVVTSDGKTSKLKQGDEIKLSADKGTFIKVDATYLKNYKISTEDNKGYYTFRIKPPKKNELDMELEVTQRGEWYQLKNHEEWEPIRATISKGGKDLTDEELEAVKITTEGNRDAEYTVKPVLGESAIDIYPGYSNGKYVEPEKGKYKVSMTASLKDKYNRELAATDKTQFEIQGYPKIFKLLSRILPILALIAFLLWWNLRKAFPKKMYFSYRGTAKPFKIKGKRMDLSANLFPGEMQCNVEKRTNHMTRKKKSAKVAINNIRPDNSVKSFTIGLGNEFIKDGNGEFVDNMGNPLKANTTFTITDNTEIQWKSRGTRSGIIKMNHK